MRIVNGLLVQPARPVKAAEALPENGSHALSHAANGSHGLADGSECQCINIDAQTMGPHRSERRRFGGTGKIDAQKKSGHCDG
jgi:hypothetical protein